MRQLRRVIVVNDFAAINGGQAKVAIESARGLARTGLEVDFFAACGPVDPDLARDGVRVHCLEQPDILSDPRRARAARRGLWNAEAARKLGALRDGADPRESVLHCHGFAKALSPSIGPVLAGRVPALYTMHEFFLACPNGGFYDYNRQEICTRRALGAACLATNCDVRHPAHKAWRVARQAVALGAGLPGALRDVISISRTQLEVMRPYLRPATRVHHVPNPVPATGPAAGARVEARQNEVFVFVGRLSPEKGCRLFAEAARRAGVRAVFVGEGPEREAIARANPDAVVTGWLDERGVRGWMERARCLVFPSLWYECAPLVTREALQLGVPVIAGAWSAAAEGIEDGVTGLLIAQATVDRLTAAIAALADPAHPVFEGVARARPAALSEAGHVERLLEVYEEARAHQLAGAPRPRGRVATGAQFRK